MPFAFTINTFRGCSHACVYCFARGTHEWLELDTGADFDPQIVVKTNIVEVLRRELARPSWKREHVALGTNTDPYQRAEGRYRLMPGVIEALARSGTPFSDPHQGHAGPPRPAAAGRGEPGTCRSAWASRWPSGTTTCTARWSPGCPTPRARLDLVRQIADAGLPCGVFLAPVLPGLTDQREHLETAIAAVAAAGATGVTVVPLHLRPGAREWFTALAGPGAPAAGQPVPAAVRPRRLRAGGVPRLAVGPGGPAAGRPRPGPAERGSGPGHRRRPARGRDGVLPVRVAARTGRRRPSPATSPSSWRCADRHDRPPRAG